MYISFGERGVDIKVIYERIAYNNMARCEAHDRYELYFLTEGDRYLFVKNTFYHLKAGDAFLLSPEVEHRTLDASGGYARLIATVPRSHFPRGSEPDCDLIISRPEGELALRVQEEIKLLCELISEDNSGISAYCSVIRLLELVLSGENIAKRATVASPTLDRVTDILKYIDSHYTEDISLISLSERFYLSEFYICRLFKEYTGRTVLGYINSLRVGRAKKLLSSTDMAIGKIARACGFGSVSSFGAAFRHRVGCSPREWRKLKIES